MILFLRAFAAGFVLLALAFMPALAQQLFVNQPVAENAVMRSASDATSTAALLKKMRSGGAAGQPVFVSASAKAGRSTLADFEPRTVAELKALAKIRNAPQEKAFQEMKIASLARQAELARKLRFEDMRRQSLERQQRAASRAAFRAQRERAAQDLRLDANAMGEDGPISVPVSDAKPPTAQAPVVKAQPLERPSLFVKPGSDPVPGVFTDFR